MSHLLFFALDIAAAATTALIAARVFFSFPGRLNAQLNAVILINTICHILLSRQDYGAWGPAALQFDFGVMTPVLGFLRNTTPGLIMILSCRLFTDRQTPPFWLLGLYLLQMTLEARTNFFPPEFASRGLLEQTLPAVLQTAFMGASLYWTVADWRSDLVDVRRRDRAIVAIIIGVQVIASALFTRVVIPADTIANYYTHVGTIAVMLGINSVILMNITRDQIARHLGLEETKAMAPVTAPQAVQAQEPDETVERLRSLLEDEKVYREPGLSLADLALKVGLPEYRLRRLIHETLGYRNFNAFMHAYRIREACALLRDPAERRTPILTIALSVGYQSINTFNRGFRDVMGVTPSDYRGGETQPAAATTENLIPKPE